MKISDIITEDSMSVQRDAMLDGILLAFRASNIDVISFNKILNDIKAAGFDVDSDWLVLKLQQIDWVDDVDEKNDIIRIRIHKKEVDTLDTQSDADASAEKVSIAAAKEVEKSIKND
ncbi:MAG: hypothetical protein WC284_07830 [Candidimonas sp.]